MADGRWGVVPAAPQLPAAVRLEVASSPPTDQRSRPDIPTCRHGDLTDHQEYDRGVGLYGLAQQRAHLLAAQRTSLRRQPDEMVDTQVSADRSTVESGPAPAPLVS